MDVKPIVGEEVPLTPLEAASPRRGGGCGCWITGLVTLIVAGALVAVGLFLPPFNLADRLRGATYAMLSPDANAVAEGALTLAVYGDDFGSNFGVALDTVPMSAFLAGSADAGAWIPDALASAPLTLALQSDVYNVRTTGETPDQVTLSVNIPAGVDTDVLDLYTWDENSHSWRFVPAQPIGGAFVTTLDRVPEHVALFQSAPPDQPRVLVSYDVTQVLSSDVGQLATFVAPAGLQPALDGKLVGTLGAGFDLNAGYLVTPALRNYSDPLATDAQTVSAILANNGLRAEHVLQVAAFAGAGYDGVLIDYRDLPDDMRANFSQFITELGQQLDQIGLLLIVTVPAAENVGGEWQTGAYDWRVIGGAADFVQINLPSDPRAFEAGADRLVEAMLRWGVGEISRDKLMIGLSARSLREVGGAFAPIGFGEALSALGDVSVEAQTSETGTIDPGAPILARLDGYNAAAGTEPNLAGTFIDYMDEGGVSVARMWLTTPEALRYRMDKTVPFALGGVAFEDLLGGGIAGGITQTILDYKLALPDMPGASELALRWTIQGSDGSVLDTVTTGLNDDLVATITAPDGNYAINVEVVGGESSGAVRGGAAVAVFAPTLTPTPLPTSTPTPTPAPTVRPVVQAQPAPAAGAPAGGGGAAVRPGSGSIVAGTFEYGGHVTGTGTGAVDAMRRAGMTWMKIQLRYSPGTDPGVAAGPIGEARARGFKILLGVVGYPNDLAAGGAGYMQQFASFLGGVAAQGPDAIEVWNEPNIDREWPAGQISGATYAEMLRLAYTAIKGANGGVMVISGAPAPTGAEAAYPGRVVNDDRFIRDMMAAGAANYMDCLGAHYNEGIIPPSARNGDPRDGYYTRFFFGMLDTYWNAIGGARPICFTELGYLSPEGYPPLDPYFGWAANVSVAQQAAWLAEAAALSSQSGRVRLLIIWNVDFSNYGTDPMAGYAMIRPGGGCPACDALAGAR